MIAWWWLPAVAVVAYVTGARVARALWVRMLRQWADTLRTSAQAAYAHPEYGRLAIGETLDFVADFVTTQVTR